MFFLMLALLRRASFLTTFYGQYFSHHYTYVKIIVLHPLFKKVISFRVPEFFNFFEHIFEHINCPLSGLFYRTGKCRSKDLRGGAFSIRPLGPIITKPKCLLDEILFSCKYVLMKRINLFESGFKLWQF